LAVEKGGVMGDSWNVIGWFVIICGCLAAAVVVGTIVKVYVQEWLTDVKRKRAHAGKLKCESEEKCGKLAIRITPRGYFCEDHWEANSKKYTFSGYVTWAHPLNYTITSERQR